MESERSLSYARFGEDGSDVYVFHSLEDMFLCVGCRIETTETGDMTASFACHTREEMLAHLRAHLVLEHKVPDRAIDRLEREIETGVDQNPLIDLLNDLEKAYEQGLPAS